MDCLDYAQQRFAEIADQATSGVVLATDVLQEVLQVIDERGANDSPITGISSGFADLDKITHGLHCGDLIIVAGRPSMGKTMLGINIAEHVAVKENKPVAVFSLEMSKEQLVERSLASLAKIEAAHLRAGKLTGEDCEKISDILPQFKAAKLFIDDRASINVSEIRAKCRRIRREHGLSGLHNPNG
jgi:replicative DNA helicase